MKFISSLNINRILFKILICVQIFAIHTSIFHYNLPLLEKLLSKSDCSQAAQAYFIFYWLNTKISKFGKRIKFNSKCNQSLQFISLNIICDRLYRATIHESMKLEKAKHRNYTQKSMHDRNRSDTKANAFAKFQFDCIQ